MKDLLLAIESGDVDGVRECLGRPDGPDVNSKCAYGFGIIHRAQEVRVVQLLIENGADVNAVDVVGFTPLHWACYRGDLEIVQVLLENGSDPFMTTVDGKTCADLALESGNRRVLQYLFAGFTHVMGLRFVLFRSEICGVFRVLPLGSRYESRKWKDRFVVLSPELASLFIWNEKTLSDSKSDLLCTIPETSVSKVDRPQTGRFGGQRIDIYFDHKQVFEPRGRVSLVIEDISMLNRFHELFRTACLEAQGFAACSIQACFRGYNCRARISRMMSIHQKLVKSRQSDHNSASSNSTLLTRSTSHDTTDSATSSPSVTSKRAKFKRMLSGFKSSRRFDQNESTNSMISTSSCSSASNSSLNINQDDVLMSGMLRKRNKSGILKYWSKPKYFEINRQEGGLIYTSSTKTPSVVPFEKMSHIKLIQDRKFKLHTTDLSTIYLLASTPKDAESWVQTLRTLLPRKTVAAVLIQSQCRMFLAKKERKRLDSLVKIEQARKDGLEKQRQLQLQMEKEGQRNDAALNIQRVWRGFAARVMVDEANTDEGVRVWVTATDPKSKKPFFYDPTRRRATWTPPEWIQTFDDTQKRYYFYNTRTRRSSWSKPLSPSQNSINALAVSHINLLLNESYTVSTIMMELPGGVLTCKLANRIIPMSIDGSKVTLNPQNDQECENNLRLVIGMLHSNGILVPRLEKLKTYRKHLGMLVQGLLQLHNKTILATARKRLHDGDCQDNLVVSELLKWFDNESSDERKPDQPPLWKLLRRTLPLGWGMEKEATPDIVAQTLRTNQYQLYPQEVNCILSAKIDLQAAVIAWTLYKHLYS